MKVYQARLVTPFAVLGIVTEQEQLMEIDFLPAETVALEPQNHLAREVCAQLQSYLADPQFRFELPLQPRGTPYQHKVWQALLKIPAGQSETYGALAKQLGSAPRAIGQACGANPIPVIIPCHRVLGSQHIGGFMNHSGGGPLLIKRWLLEHEHGELRPAG
ncbi:MAG: methylated-DNA--[protein]-cysteine S-methyltransferase [Sulfurimicrobium sp.]|nr:methylated-DNA--[protein]-cysteine S-methyltransferase [Sulfurimicrobium sp.]